LFTQNDLVNGKVTHHIVLDAQINRTGDVWHVALPDLDSELLYGYRIKGPTANGHAKTAGQAFDEVFEVLSSFQGLHRGVFHCFSGDFAQAQRAISLGLHLGIGGVVTFKNGGIDQWLREVPLEHLVLETDAPYLAPVPHRGKRNEPEFLTLVVAKLAALYEVSEQEIGRVTTANAQSLFKWSDEIA